MDGNRGTADAENILVDRPARNLFPAWTLPKLCPSMRVTGSHAHTKLRVKLQFYMLKSSASRREACFSRPRAPGTGRVLWR